VSVETEPISLRARTTLVDHIVAAVRGRIVRGELKPGEKIRQQEFAESLGVSRTPLREAFQKLESEGWVDLHARRGAEVRPLTASEAEEIFGMRIILETAAAGISAIRHAAADEPLAAVLIDPATDLSIVGSGARIEDANGRFHGLVYGLGSGCLPRELEAELEGYWARALRYRLVYWSQKSAVDRSREAHRALYTTWVQRDAPACQRAVAAHILTALREITERIDRHHVLSPALDILSAR
jgi:DNA-binding GntR family transcriptional regulator